MSKIKNILKEKIHTKFQILGQLNNLNSVRTWTIFQERHALD
jgi:hypothetical protein